MSIQNNGRQPQAGTFEIGKYRITKSEHNKQYWKFSICNTDLDSGPAITPDRTIVFQAVPGYIRRCMDEQEITDIWGWQTETETQKGSQRERYTARTDLENRKQNGIRRGLRAAT